MRLRETALLSYLLIAVLSLTGVIFRGAMTADGLVLGLPAGLAWVMGWSLATFVVFAAYDATRPDRGGAPDRRRTAGGESS
jgi:hypothetical protein